MPKNKKIPKWVLIDQIHIDVNIRSNMPMYERRAITKLLASESFKNLIKAVIKGVEDHDPGGKNIKVEISR